MKAHGIGQLAKIPALVHLVAIYLTEISLNCRGTLGTNSAISWMHTCDQVFPLEIDQMCSLFIFGQIRPDPLRHDHNECAVIHVHPIATTNKLVRSVLDEGTIGLNA